MISRKGWCIAFSVGLVVSGITTELFYRQYLGNIYLFATMVTADSAKRVMVDEGARRNAGKQIYFFKARENLKWAFEGDEFFRYYSGQSSLHINYITAPEQIPAALLARGEVVVYAIDSHRQVVDATDTAKRYFGLR